MTDMLATAAGALAETAVKTVAKRAKKAVAKRTPTAVKKAAKKVAKAATRKKAKKSAKAAPKKSKKAAKKTKSSAGRKAVRTKKSATRVTEEGKEVKTLALKSICAARNQHMPTLASSRFARRSRKLRNACTTAAR